MGLNGKERSEALKFFFKSYINLLIPMLSRQLLWTLSEKTEHFASIKTPH